jgi:hypothetical protein
LQRLERGASATNTDYHYQCYAPGIKQKATSVCFASPYGMVESGRYWQQKKNKKNKKKRIKFTFSYVFSIVANLYAIIN